MRLKREFFNRPTLSVAHELIGKTLCRKIGGKVVRVRITETEAYCGMKDLACHASKGMTPRTKIMFGPPARAYIYMIYGMYFCLNIVTEEEGNPSAVLIRSAEFQSRVKTENLKPNHLKPFLRGPGILCRELKINKSLNGEDILNSGKLWIEDNPEGKFKIKKGKRIGVDYAGKWKDKLWRFSIDT